MIKTIDASLYKYKEPKIRFYDTEKRCFVKNIPQNRAKALFAMVLNDSFFDIEQYELEGYANKFVDLLKKNQEKPFIGIDDVDEFIDDLERIFNMKDADMRHGSIFEVLATYVVYDQKKKECAFNENDINELVDSVKNEERFEM